jgi:hypothetical protein
MKRLIVGPEPPSQRTRELNKTFASFVNDVTFAASQVESEVDERRRVVLVWSLCRAKAYAEANGGWGSTSSLRLDKIFGHTWPNALVFVPEDKPDVLEAAEKLAPWALERSVNLHPRLYGALLDLSEAQIKECLAQNATVQLHPGGYPQLTEDPAASSEADARQFPSCAHLLAALRGYRKDIFERVANAALCQRALGPIQEDATIEFYDPPDYMTGQTLLRNLRCGPTRFVFPAVARGAEPTEIIEAVAAAARAAASCWPAAPPAGLVWNVICSIPATRWPADVTDALKWRRPSAVRRLARCALRADCAAASWGSPLTPDVGKKIVSLLATAKKPFASNHFQGFGRLLCLCFSSEKVVDALFEDWSPLRLAARTLVPPVNFAAATPAEAGCRNDASFLLAQVVEGLRSPLDFSLATACCSFVALKRADCNTSILLLCLCLMVTRKNEIFELPKARALCVEAIAALLQRAHAEEGPEPRSGFATLFCSPGALVGYGRLVENALQVRDDVDLESVAQKLVAPAVALRTALDVADPRTLWVGIPLAPTALLDGLKGFERYVGGAHVKVARTSGLFPAADISIDGCQIFHVENSGNLLSLAPCTGHRDEVGLWRAYRGSAADQHALEFACLAERITPARLQRVIDHALQQAPPLAACSCSCPMRFFERLGDVHDPEAAARAAEHASTEEVRAAVADFETSTKARVVVRVRVTKLLYPPGECAPHPRHALEWSEKQASASTRLPETFVADLLEVSASVVPEYVANRVVNRALCLMKRLTLAPNKKNKKTDSARIEADFAFPDVHLPEECVVALRGDEHTAEDEAECINSFCTQIANRSVSYLIAEHNRYDWQGREVRRRLLEAQLTFTLCGRADPGTAPLVTALLAPGDLRHELVGSVAISLVSWLLGLDGARPCRRGGRGW